jgi:hypothetical protein
MAMSALFTIYMAIAPEKGYKARVAELLKINRRSKRLAKAANRRKIIFEDWDKDFFVISVGKKVRTKPNEQKLASTGRAHLAVSRKFGPRDCDAPWSTLTRTRLALMPRSFG